ncbi:hypothetical protein N7509_012371 [Penicillium cosmopolitanum]|uniref:Uncharacterized protein n=1 Tax=Penicillium cosmopolitanum TaxID=1131564 RepID=A0A9W9SIT0_9EURO|nr:uncharacterized protein N7509_012371 [Penicillium cosmopolitanum]KAJ5379252.1 hypothetical protein N7509_012371 [Penicillium cosmopolitanum]
MSDNQANGEGLPAASLSNTITYLQLHQPPSIESVSKRDKKADGNVSKADKKELKAVVKAVDKAVNKADDKADDDKTDGKTDRKTGDETDDEDSRSRKMIPSEKLYIIDAINKVDKNEQQIQAAIEKALSSDIFPSFREIYVAVYPDKFPKDYKKEKATKNLAY